MAFGFYYSDHSLQHVVTTIPETAARYLTIRDAVLQLPGIDPHRIDTFADIGHIAAIHDRNYIKLVEAICAQGGGELDWDTPLVAGSWDAARAAAQLGIAAIDDIMRGTVTRAFLLTRPPGHHAEQERGMGFCLFNNIAIAADYAVRRHGLQRVMIVDWDIHHGNGTQHTFADRNDVFFFSVHQHPHYPGTGLASERGSGPGEGYTLNCPLPAGSGANDYRTVFTEQWLPAARDFKPELILISAGFDPHGDDPLSGTTLSAEDFPTALVRGVAEEFSQGRVLSFLEGGYNLPALKASVLHHIKELK